MFYPLMQQYLRQQLQQLQNFQYQQSQYLDWHYRQLQAWQNILLNSPFFSQMPWLPNSNIWLAGFAPFSWPFIQYTMQMNRQPINTEFRSSSRQPTKQLRDIAAHFNQVQQTLYTNRSQGVSDTPSDTATTEQNKLAVNATSEVARKTVSETTNNAANPQPNLATTEKLVVPPELLTEPPKQAEVAPPQADIPQPKESKQIEPEQVSNHTASDKNKVANTTIPVHISDAEKVLRQLQREETDLPAPAKLAKVETAMAAPTSTDNLASVIGNIEPVSAIEQVRQAVELIDLNQATEAQLLKLDGINRRIAKEIINYRDKHTAFSNLDELTQIKGIGQSTLNKIRHCLIINHEAADNVKNSDNAHNMTQTTPKSSQTLSPVSKK